MRLPWLTCQKQAPSEAAVLQQVKSLVGRQRGQQQAQAGQQQAGKPRAASPSSHATSSTLDSPGGSSCSGGSVTSPAPGKAASAAAAWAGAGAGDGAAAGGASGPLLLFPDTSALLSMIGGWRRGCVRPCRRCAPAAP